jgi:hypothetical protein
MADSTRHGGGAGAAKGDGAPLRGRLLHLSQSRVVVQACAPNPSASGKGRVEARAGAWSARQCKEYSKSKAAAEEHEVEMRYPPSQEELVRIHSRRQNESTATLAKDPFFFSKNLDTVPRRVPETRYYDVSMYDGAMWAWESAAWYNENTHESVHNLRKLFWGALLANTDTSRGLVTAVLYNGDVVFDLAVLGALMGGGTRDAALALYTYVFGFCRPRRPDLASMELASPPPGVPRCLVRLTWPVFATIWAYQENTANSRTGFVAPRADSPHGRVRPGRVTAVAGPGARAFFAAMMGMPFQRRWRHYAFYGGPNLFRGLADDAPCPTYPSARVSGCTRPALS